MTRRLSWPISTGIVAAAAIIGIVGGGLIGAGSGSDQPVAGSTPTSTSSPEPTASASDSPESTSGNALTIEANETEVSADSRVDFTGQLEPPIGGVELQVERSIDGGEWEDFPVTVTTQDDGSFSTWIASGRVGENEFRLTGQADGSEVESNTVTVMVN